MRSTFNLIGLWGILNISVIPDRGVDRAGILCRASGFAITNSSMLRAFSLILN
ncbi:MULTISPECIES: hypothetical protein [unclassified Microcoleus]|uniref:hypothetical protein n=1 Tax=unclassified Microcoleus TaxID=2642155 RepID=UPI002FD541D3